MTDAGRAVLTRRTSKSILITILQINANKNLYQFQKKFNEVDNKDDILGFR